VEDTQALFKFSQVFWAELLTRQHHGFPLGMHKVERIFHPGVGGATDAMQNCSDGWWLLWVSGEIEVNGEFTLCEIFAMSRASSDTVSCSCH
jgi:hypothetical protein